VLIAITAIILHVDAHPRLKDILEGTRARAVACLVDPSRLHGSVEKCLKVAPEFRHVSEISN
jgi:hypothetical protein